MKTALQVGLKGQSETVVGKELLASEVGSGLVTVYSTAMMIAGMEGRMRWRTARPRWARASMSRIWRPRPAA